MKFTIEIDCDNAAFEGAGLENEVMRILDWVKIQVSQCQRGNVCYDVNGNRVGEWKLTDN